MAEAAKAAALKSLRTDALFIGGAWRGSSGGGAYNVTDATTGRPLAPAVQASAADVDAAVQAAAAAWKTWRWTAPEERARVLRAVADKLAERKAVIAAIEALNTGKPLREAESDMDDSIAAFRFNASQAEGLAKRLPTTPDPLPAAEFSGQIIYEPVGVVAAICPWNFPTTMCSWKLSSALAAGCTFVVKPSEFTPFATLELADICAAAGVPAGVVNVVTGDGAVGAALTAHKLVDKVSFTGSIPTGVKVMKAAADSVKRVTLELGGKSPAIVFDDANLESGLEWVAFGTFWNCGQICSATTRLLVQESIAEAFTAKLAAAAKKIVIGGPFEAGSECGPVGNKMQYEKVMRYIELTKAEGGRLVTGGSAPAGKEEGFFLAPTIFAGITPAHTIFREEVFGPVCSITTFKTVEEAIELANNSEYGLAAAVFSTDPAKLERCNRELRAGTIWNNNSQPSPPQQPWGGFKKSGIGRELGPFSLMPFLEAKAVTGWDASAKLGWYPATHFQ